MNESNDMEIRVETEAEDLSEQLRQERRCCINMELENRDLRERLEKAEAEKRVIEEELRWLAREIGDIIDTDMLAIRQMVWHLAEILGMDERLAEDVGTRLLNICGKAKIIDGNLEGVRKRLLLSAEMVGDVTRKEH